MMDEADAAVDGVQRPQRVRQERLAGGCQQQRVDAPIELVEFVERDGVVFLLQHAFDVKRLIAVREAGPLRRELDDEALDVAPQSQQQPFARQIDRRDLQAMARLDQDQRIGGELVHGVVHRGASESGHGLQFLHGEESSRLSLAIVQQILDALIGELEEVDAVTPARRAAFVGADQFESALAACHPSFLRPRFCRVAMPISQTCCDILQGTLDSEASPPKIRPLQATRVHQLGATPRQDRAIGRRPAVKITSIETLRTEEFANVIWVRVHTDAGLIGLGQTFYGAGAVEAQIHDTFAARLLGRDPLQIEAIHRDMLNLPMAQSSTGVEYRAASAIDIALWDLFGKVCHQPVHQMLGGLCRDRQRIYNTCAGYKYVRSTNIKPVSNWNLGVSDGPFEDLDGFMNRADAVAESLLESGIGAMKIWPFDPAAQENHGLFISAEQMKKAIEPFEKIRKAVGDKMEIMVEFHSLWNLPTAMKIAKALEPYNPTWYEDPIRMNSPQALAEYARSTDVWVCASETLGSRYPYKDMLDRDAMHVVMADLCWTGGLTEGRKIAAMAETYHRPFAPHDCIGPVGFAAAVHTSFSQPNTLIQESVRSFYTGWYKELVTVVPTIKDGYVYPMEGEGLCIDLLPAVYRRSDLTVRRTNS